MRAKLLVALTAAATLLIPAATYSAAASASGVRSAASAPPTIQPAIPGTSSNFELVGHNPLFHRGMNAAATIFGNYLYVGNRSDGSNTCPDGSTGCVHPHPGILILNIANPAGHDIPVQDRVLRPQRPRPPQVHRELRAHLGRGPGGQAARDVPVGRPQQPS